jgi:hypothetical protein
VRTLKRLLCVFLFFLLPLVSAKTNESQFLYPANRTFSRDDADVIPTGATLFCDVEYLIIFVSGKMESRTWDSHATYGLQIPELNLAISMLTLARRTLWRYWLIEREKLERTVGVDTVQIRSVKYNTTGTDQIPTTRFIRKYVSSQPLDPGTDFAEIPPSNFSIVIQDGLLIHAKIHATRSSQ